MRADPWDGDDELRDQREVKGREELRKEMSSLILCYSASQVVNCILLEGLNMSKGNGLDSLSRL